MESAPPDGSPASGPDPERAEEAWRWCVRAGVLGVLLASAGAGFALDASRRPAGHWIRDAAIVTLGGAAVCFLVVAARWGTARAAYRRTRVRPHFLGKGGVFPTGVQFGGVTPLGSVVDGEIARVGDAIEVRFEPVALEARWLMLFLVLPSWMLLLLSARGVGAVPMGFHGLLGANTALCLLLVAAPSLRLRFREVHAVADVERIVLYHDGAVFHGHGGLPLLRLRTPTRVEAARIAALFEGHIPAVDIEDLVASPPREDDEGPGPSAGGRVPA